MIPCPGTNGSWSTHPLLVPPGITEHREPGNGHRLQVLPPRAPRNILQQEHPLVGFLWAHITRLSPGTPLSSTTLWSAFPGYVLQSIIVSLDLHVVAYPSGHKSPEIPALPPKQRDTVIPLVLGISVLLGLTGLGTGTWP